MAGSWRRQDHYEVLGVVPDAPDEVIRAAYKALAAKYHPDRNPGDGTAELKLKRLNAAYAVVGDPHKRRQYDELTQSPDDGAPGSTAKAPQEAPASAAREPSQPRTPAAEAAEPSPPRPTGAERAATGAMGGLARLVGWGAGVALVSVVGHEMRGGCDDHGASSAKVASSNYVSATSATTTDPAAQTATATWVWTTQRDYRIAFPDTPRPADHTTEPSPLGMVNETSIKLSRPSGAFYSVEQFDYPKGSVLSEQGAIDGAINGAGQAAHETPRRLSDNRVRIGDCNGRPVTIAVRAFTTQMMLCINGSHSYLAGVATPTGASAQELIDANTFLGTFAVTMPAAKPVAPPAPTNSAGPKTGRDFLCAMNPLCARCRDVFGQGEDCYRYLDQPAQPKPKDCGCGADLDCLLKCPTM